MRRQDPAPSPLPNASPPFLICEPSNPNPFLIRNFSNQTISLSLSLSRLPPPAPPPPPPHRTAPGPAPTRQLRFPSPSFLHLDRAPNPKAQPHSLHLPRSRAPPLRVTRSGGGGGRGGGRPPSRGSGGGCVRVCFTRNREALAGVCTAASCWGQARSEIRAGRCGGSRGWRRGVGVI